MKRKEEVDEKCVGVSVIQQENGGQRNRKTRKKMFKEERIHLSAAILIT